MDIVSEKKDGVLRIQFHRPQKKNAITAAMYAALAEALAAAEHDPDVRAIVLHGDPGAFTAGADLEDFLENPPAGNDAPVFRFLQQLSGANKPLVAAVTGVAVGIGTTLLLHCDLVYAGEGVKFSLPFARLGLCPEAASSYLLPAIAGYQRAAEKLLLAEPFDAAEALACGFVNRVLPDDQVLAHAMARAAALAALPTGSLRATKALMKRSLKAHVEEQMREEGAQFLRMLGAPAAREAFSAFLEKRKPDFLKLG